MTSSLNDSPTLDFFEPRRDHIVAVGCRFHDPSRLDLLSRAVNSVLAMADVSVQCIVACQDFSADDLAAVGAAMRPLETIHKSQVDIFNVLPPQPGDARSLLLNEIINRIGEGDGCDYLMFVDYDDVVFSHAAVVLINSIVYSGCDFAYAKVLDADVLLTGTSRFIRKLTDLHHIDRRYRPDLYRANFLPLHSYMFDARAVIASQIRYDTSLSRLEDYDFLLRFLKDRPASPLAQHILIGLYNFYDHIESEDVNTTSNPFTPNIAADPAWAAAVRLIQSKLATAPVRSFASDFPLGVT